MKEKMKTRVLAIILTICMVIAMVPMAAFADDDSAGDSGVKNYTITLIANHEGAKFYEGREGAVYSDDYTKVTFTCPSNEAIRYASGYTNAYVDRTGEEDIWYESSYNMWNSKADGTGESFDAETTRPSRDMTLYAVWDLKVRVTFYANGGLYYGQSGNTSKWWNRSINKRLDSQPHEPAAPEGKRFTGWYRDKACTDQVESIRQEVITESNHEFYAGWTDKDAVTLTINPNGGKFRYSHSEYAEKNGSYQKGLASGKNADVYDELLIRDGYKFTGWYLDQDCTRKVEDFQISKDTTLYAGWKELSEDTYTVILKALAPGYYLGRSNDGYYEAVHELKYQVQKGDSISDASDITDVYPDVQFDTATVMLDAMYMDQNAKGRIDNIWEYTPTQDITLYAIYKEYSNVKWYAGEGGYFKYRERNGEKSTFSTDRVMKGEKDDPGSDILDGSALANQDSNLAFLGWYKQDPATGLVTDEKLDTSKELVPDGDVTYEAKWATGNQVTFNFNGGTGWAYDDNGEWQDNLTEIKKIIPEGSTVEKVLPTFESRIRNDGDKTALTGWYTDADCTQPFDLKTPISQPVTLYAKWEEADSRIVLEPSDSVSIGAQITASFTTNGRNLQDSNYWWDLEINENDNGDPVFAQMSKVSDYTKNAFVVQAVNAGSAVLYCSSGSAYARVNITATPVSEKDKQPAITASGTPKSMNSVSISDHHTDEVNAANETADLLKKANDAVTGDGIAEAAALAVANNTDNAETKRSDIDALNLADYTETTPLAVVYQTYMDYDVVDTQIAAADSGEENRVNSITVEATPMVQKLVTTEEIANSAKAGNTELVSEGNGQNSVKIGEATKLNVTAPVDMKIPVANDLFSDTDKIYVLHNTTNDGTKQYGGELIKEENGQEAVKFTNPDGFSTFKITTEDSSVAKVGDEYFLNLDEAIRAAAERDETLTLTRDFDPEDYVAYYETKKSVDIDPNGHKFNTDQITLELYTEDEYELKWTRTPDEHWHSEVSLKQKETEKHTYHSSTGSSRPVTFVFSDVRDSSKYYYEPVYWAHRTGIAAGTSATTFSPSANCSRAQIVTMLWKKAGSPASSADISKFTDVKNSAYYAKAVAWALEKGITAGTSETTFSPNADCTRAQAMTFLYKMEKAENKNSENPFTDIVAGKYYYDPVLWGVAKGVTSGTTPTTFTPSGTVSRGQMVTFLHNLYS